MKGKNIQIWYNHLYCFVTSLGNVTFCLFSTGIARLTFLGTGLALLLCPPTNAIMGSMEKMFYGIALAGKGINCCDSLSNICVKNSHI